MIVLIFWTTAVTSHFWFNSVDSKNFKNKTENPKFLNVLIGQMINNAFKIGHDRLISGQIIAIMIGVNERFYIRESSSE